MLRAIRSDVFWLRRLPFRKVAGIAPSTDSFITTRL
jgi:hypothetical protein